MIQTIYQNLRLKALQLSSFILLVPTVLHAQGGNSGNNGNNSGNGGNGNGDGPLVDGLSNIMDALPTTMTEGTLGTFVINLINWFLGILGVVFVIIVLYAGFKYMRSENAQGTQEAISLITNAIIGLIIIMGAYLITQYIASALT